jgi:hypothetical protein
MRLSTEVFPFTCFARRLEVQSFHDRDKDKHRRGQASEYLADLRSPAGAIGLAAQVCFATFPLLEVVVRRGL